MGNIRNMIEMAKIISGYSREEALRRYEVCRDRFTDGDNTLSRNFDLVMEASMLLQRIMDLAKEEVKRDEAMDFDSQPAWVIPPKHDNQDFWLDKYGQRIWNLGDTTKSAHRSYYWCDRVIILDKMRKVLEDIKFSDFVNRIDAEGWEPVIPDEPVKFDKE